MRVRRHILREKPSNRAIPTTDRAALSTAPTASPCRRHPVSAGTGAEYLGGTQTNRRNRTPRRPPDGVAKRDTPAATGSAFQMRSLPQGSISNLILQVTRDNPSRFRAPCLGSRLPLSTLFYSTRKKYKIATSAFFIEVAKFAKLRPYDDKTNHKNRRN